MKRCANCLLPAELPGSGFNEKNICAFCQDRTRDPLQPWVTNREKYEKNLTQAIEEARRSTGRYQALVCLSGGKDSLYLLYKLQVEHKLRVLAFTTDISIPDIAWDNIHRTIAKLQTDHMIWRPHKDFYTKLFRYLLTHQEERGAVYTVSYVYAPLFEGDALHMATQMKIPVVFAGYSPGQPEPERMVYEFSRDLIEKIDWIPPQIRRSGEFSKEEMSYFWNPQNYPAGTKFPRYIAPYHAWAYDQEAIIAKVYELGLVKKKHFASPIFSNYPINWLLMYSDLRNLKYNPYAPEFCALIRTGKASRSYWRVMAPFVDFIIRHKVLLGSETRRAMEWLQLKDEDLKINMPRGAYDPPVA